MAYVEYEKSGHVVTITMNRPERMNAMGLELMTQLAEAFTQYQNDDDAWVAILTGRGRAFCAGEDLKEAVERGTPGLPPLPVRNPFREDALDKLVIAAVNGWALGGGYVMASQADLRIAAEGAIFEISEIHRAWIGGFRHGINQGLTYAHAAELVLGERISARRALEMGFVNKVVPDVDLMKEATAWAEKICTLPPLAVRETVKLLHRIKPRMAPDHFQEFTDANQMLAKTEDAMESRRSFVEKRPPVYKGR